MDYKPHRNIEEWFLAQPKELFPHSTDYPAVYGNAKDILEKQVHNEIKSIAITYIPEEYLNDHGVRHVNTVINRASELLKKSDFSLTPYETFLLLMGIQLHDTGHIMKGRKEHREKIAPIINKVVNPLSIQTSEKKTINKIARSHSGKDDPIKGLPNDDHFSETFYPQVLAAIIRISDELADDCLRASSFLLEIESDKINEHSKLFHMYSKCLDSCRIFANAHEVELSFVLNKDSVKNTITTTDGETYLVDEIYKNTLKTFTECLYCNRFLPSQLKINRLSVKIEFIDSEQLEDFLEPIEYRVEENGYPILSYPSVHQICVDALHKDGAEINGLYLKTRLENNEKESV